MCWYPDLYVDSDIKPKIKMYGAVLACQQKSEGDLTYIQESKLKGLEEKLQIAREKDDQLIKMLVSNFYWDQAEPEELKTARELQKKYFPENFEEIS